MESGNANKQSQHGWEGRIAKFYEDVRVFQCKAYRLSNKKKESDV